jgi:iron complex transport system ATP-binding protein
MLDIEGVTVTYGERTVLDGVSFSVRAGEWWMVVGPNGSGKTTLVGALSQGLPYDGVIYFEGSSLRGARPTEIARKMAVLSQQNSASYAFSVEEVVSLGRYAWRKGMLSGLSAEDKEMIDSALRQTGMDEFRKRSILTLSGGELQRAFLAQVLAQDARLLVLDEATNHLDLVYQRQTFDLVREWVKRPGRAAISVVHDLTLAKAYGTHALMLSEGCCVAKGKADGVFTPHNLEDTFKMDVHGWMRGNLENWK